MIYYFLFFFQSIVFAVDNNFLYKGINAIYNKDLAVIEELIQEEQKYWLMPIPSVVYSDIDDESYSVDSSIVGMSLLFFAVGKGNLFILEYLINNGLDLNIVIDNGCLKGANLLYVAVLNNYFHIVKYLLNQGLDPFIDVFAEGISLSSPLNLAIKKGYIEIVQYIIKENKDIILESIFFEKNILLKSIDIAKNKNQNEIVFFLLNISDCLVNYAKNIHHHRNNQLKRVEKKLNLFLKQSKKDLINFYDIEFEKIGLEVIRSCCESNKKSQIIIDDNFNFSK